MQERAGGCGRRICPGRGKSGCARATTFSRGPQGGGPNSPRSQMFPLFQSHAERGGHMDSSVGAEASRGGTILPPRHPSTPIQVPHGARACTRARSPWARAGPAAKDTGPRRMPAASHSHDCPAGVGQGDVATRVRPRHAATAAAAHQRMVPRSAPGATVTSAPASWQRVSVLHSPGIVGAPDVRCSCAVRKHV